MVTLENGGIVKSIHGGLYKDSVWYSIYGSKGRLESARRDAQNNYYNRIYINADEFSGEYGEEKIENYIPEGELDKFRKGFEHGGSDFDSMYYFVERIKGDKDADIIDVYEAMDMFLPGMFAYRSILAGGKAMEIPNLRDKAVREKYRNDTACTDPNVAGDMLLPTFSLGTPEIEDEVYDIMKKKWEEELNNRSDYVGDMFKPIPDDEE